VVRGWMSWVISIMGYLAERYFIVPFEVWVW